VSHVTDTQRYTLLCTANNVKTCNAQQAAVDYLTMKERDLPEELTVPQIKYSLHFLQHESSLQCSQQRKTSSYPEPDSSNPRPSNLFISDPVQCYSPI
jgi:hypothetical protein